MSLVLTLSILWAIVRGGLVCDIWYQDRAWRKFFRDREAWMRKEFR